jgi:hypothetical protein
MVCDDLELRRILCRVIRWPSGSGASLKHEGHPPQISFVLSNVQTRFHVRLSLCVGAKGGVHAEGARRIHGT